MTPSAACFDLIKRFEGCRLEAYPDPGTGDAPWSVGFGHTGPEVHAGLHISQSVADAYLLKDVTHAADAIDHVLSVEVTQGQFDALCSFVFNVGPGAFAKSSLLRKINDGDMLGASLEVLKWDHAAGKVMPGLTARRAAEQSLFLS